MHLSDTIFALSTATGKAGIAVIRVSGAQAKDLFGTVIPHPCPVPNTVLYTAVIDPQSQETIDLGLCLFFAAPQSFTGEDVVELHLHGSVAVLKNIIGILTKMPTYRHAEAGEFSKRGFLNNKFDLTQAESLIDLIEAETDHQRRAALENTRGALFHLYSEWRASLQELCAYCEACLDFADEDLPDDLEEHILTRSNSLLQSIRTHLATASQGTRMRLGTKVTIIGPSNAGKSSLLNYFAQNQAAIISPIAGTTRDSIEQHVDIAGYAVKLVDTAGVQDTHDLIELAGINRAQEQAETADLVLLMFDGSQPITIDPRFINMTKNTQTIIIINKLDQGFIDNNNTIITREYSSKSIVKISLKQATGLKNLDEALKKSLEKLAGNSHTPLVMHARYQQALERSEQALERIVQSLQDDDKFANNEKNIELIAEELRQSLNALGQILGYTDVEDLLGIVFSRFCIGK